jgi:hypothetical protein
MWGNFSVSTLRYCRYVGVVFTRAEDKQRPSLSYRFLSGVGVWRAETNTGDWNYGLEMVEAKSI